MRATQTLALLVSVAALALAGCAALQRNETETAEALLVAAGFQAEPADTAEKLASLKEMPPRKLVSRDRDGHRIYSYADPDRCLCLYVGGPQEYSAYQRLVDGYDSDSNYHVNAQ